jgi:hypothetical protein
MLRKIGLACAAAVFVALCLGGPDGSVASADPGAHGPMEHHLCVYTAHGSPAAEAEDARDAHGNGGGHGGGGGGGGPSATCSKTFAKWNKTSLVVHIDSTNEPASLFGSTSFLQYVQHALGQWGCASSALSFDVSEGTASGADITVSWGDLGSTGILGQTYTSYSSGIISHSDVTMNTNSVIVWTVGGPALDSSGCETVTGTGSGADYDFLSVLTHECGHALGVAHPNNRCRSSDSCYPQTMYSCTDTEEWFRRSLDTGDTASITSLYGN